MLNVVNTSRAKKKYGYMGSNMSYRENVISSKFIKSFECCILQNLMESDILSRLEFARQAKSSITLAIAILKEVLIKYTSESNNVYTWFMDTSKEFEKVNKDILVRKLTELKVYPLTVRAIKLISTACAKFKDYSPIKWCIMRGVRQGGVTSAHIF